MGGVDPGFTHEGCVAQGSPGSREAASFEVCIFPHSSVLVIIIVMVWTGWTVVLRPVRPDGGR
jgi:hypothetical protein